MMRNLLLTFFCLASMAWADALGDHGGSGGDPLAGDFVARGEFLLQSFKTGADQGLLDRGQIAKFESALRTTRIEFVDKPLPELAVPTANDPQEPTHALIQVVRKDWVTSQQLNQAGQEIDLVRTVSHAYLRVADIDDADYVTTDKLKVREVDFLNRALQNPNCPAGRLEPVRITLNISGSFSGLREPAYLNGVDVNPGDRTSFRVFGSERLCTSKTFQFRIDIGGFGKTLELYGGARVTLMVPSGQVYRE